MLRVSSDPVSSDSRSTATLFSLAEYATLACAIVLTLAGAWWAILDNRSDVVSFNALSGAFDLLATIGLFIEHSATDYFSRWTYFIAGSVAFAALLLGLRARSNLKGVAVTVFLSVAATGCVLGHALFVGIPALACAGVMLYMSPYASFSSGLISSNEVTRTAWNSTDTYLCLLITTLGLLLRVYALNRIMPDFEGELSPYFLGATDLHGMFYANEGRNGPWAPLGLLYYLPIWLMIQLDSATLLAVRLGSVLPSTITVTLVYILARRVGGRAAAVIGALLLALDNLQIGWGRTDVHPHGSTSWITLLLIIATIHAVKSSGLRAWWFVAAVMGLSWHQYPSGQSAVLIPFAGLLYGLFTQKRNKTAAIRWCFNRSIPVATGIGIWCLSPSIVRYIGFGEFQLPHYIAALGPRVYANQLPEGQGSFTESVVTALMKAIAHGGDLIAGLFSQAPYLFHQDILVPVPGIPLRTITFFGGLLLLFGLAALIKNIRLSHSGIILWALILAMLPAMFSDSAYPKRASNIFPLIAVIGGIGFQWWWELLAKARSRTASAIPVMVASGALTAQLCLICWLWFGGDRIKYYKPIEEQVIERITPHITPGTVIGLWAMNHYFEGKFAYLLHDNLSASKHFPTVFYPEQRARAGEIADVPTEDQIHRHLQSQPYYYLWSKIRSQANELINQHFSRQILIVELSAIGQKQVEHYKQMLPSARIEQIQSALDPNRKFAVLYSKTEQ